MSEHEAIPRGESEPVNAWAGPWPSPARLWAASLACPAGVLVLALVVLLLCSSCAPTHPEARHIVATTSTIATTTTVATTTTTVPAAPVTAVPRASREAARPRGPTASGAVATSGDVWEALARCETGMRNDTGDPYWGYFQFLPSTWRSLGYSGLPSDHSYATQREAATRLVARSGFGQFPACARKLGLL